MSPTQRSLAHIRKIGYCAQVVEHWNPFAHRRIDLFGVIDIVVLDCKDHKLLGVQTCSGCDHAKRRSKALDEPRLPLWLLCGGRFEIWSWSKLGARGKRKLWSVRIEAITLENFRYNGKNWVRADDLPLKKISPRDMGESLTGGEESERLSNQRF